MNHILWLVYETARSPQSLFPLQSGLGAASIYTDSIIRSGGGKSFLIMTIYDYLDCVLLGSGGQGRFSSSLIELGLQEPEWNPSSLTELLSQNTKAETKSKPAWLIKLCSGVWLDFQDVELINQHPCQVVQKERETAIFYSLKNCPRYLLSTICKDWRFNLKILPLCQQSGPSKWKYAHTAHREKHLQGSTSTKELWDFILV